MTRGSDWPSNIELCAEGEHPFCTGCEPRAGACSRCNRTLCWLHLSEAHADRCGLCTDCGVDGEPGTEECWSDRYWGDRPDYFYRQNEQAQKRRDFLHLQARDRAIKKAQEGTD